MATQTVEPAIKDFTIDGGNFRGTDTQYQDFLTTHPQPKATAPAVIDASQIGGDKLATPELPQAQSVDSFVQNLFNQYNAPVDEALKTTNDLTSKLTTASTALEGKGAAQIAKEAELGIPQDTAKLKDLNTLIATKSAEYQNRIAALPGQGRGLTTGLVQAQTDREKRMAAVELGGLASVAQALQGNIALSQDMAQRAVDMQFAPIEQQIKNTLTLLQLNEGNLTRAESKRAEEIKIALSERQRQLDEQKQNKLDILNTAKQAALAGADNATVAKVLNSTDPQSAFNLVAPFISSQVVKERKQADETFALDKQYKQMQIANIRSEIANRGQQNQGYDPSEILAYAQQYASTGKIPTGIPKGSFGILSQVAKELPKPDGTLVNKNTGIAPDLSATEQEAIAALQDINKRLPGLRADFDKMIPGLISGTIGNIFPSKTKQNYLSQRDEILNLLLKARSGAAVSEQEFERYKKLLPTTFNKTLFLGGSGVNKIDNFTKSIQNSLNSKLQSSGLSIYGYSKVKVGEQEYTVGDVISNGAQSARVNPDGTLTIIQ